MEENDKEIFRDYVKDNAEMIVNWQIKTGEPASEAIARVYQGYVRSGHAAGAGKRLEARRT